MKYNKYYRVQPKGLDLPEAAHTSSSDHECSCQYNQKEGDDRFNPDCPDCEGTGWTLPLKGKIFVFRTLGEIRSARKHWAVDMAEMEILVIETDEGDEDPGDLEGVVIPREGAKIVKRKPYKKT